MFGMLVMDETVSVGSEHLEAEMRREFVNL